MVCTPRQIDKHSCERNDMLAGRVENCVVEEEKELSDVQSKDAASILQNLGVSYENVSRTVNAYKQLMG